MRAKKIATALVIILLDLLICVPIWYANRKHAQDGINLNEPIYFVVDYSFFKDCDHTPEDTCLSDRLVIFTAGIDDWFNHFAEVSRPKAVIVFSVDDVPENAANTPIYLQIEDNGCIVEGSVRRACYMGGTPAKIIFDNPENIDVPTSAHEIGHALGLDHRPSDSIMSYRDRNIVQPIDIITLCEQNNTCPPHDTVWCKGSFYNSCRCPSTSFEASEEGRVCE
ncbi:MAG: hypothetical protein A2534_00165 [Candidatus Magasanikbacteria bacterium RIFOXYD2_FULL_39_9]|uniref:Peptidase M10 metallopeptidase domain-containing protein n=1 Tax=Candidatus Magasanikbacteria bacterium RIFOXYD1_FULL_40_23 TaxID=1798705 RepID=A0A1F6P939_9BACT|nr:MAG: hypothetical protein A2563_02940 [Candidatus Magasanikbacteria bacterium RIFOXYD1_FULL_40_23]OGH93559.1 MAG: hypothetical protein A2534_00165 [Candidatus Magasanikbacteria bacterium RIFOXYD2_FULL_39_9]